MINNEEMVVKKKKGFSKKSFLNIFVTLFVIWIIYSFSLFVLKSMADSSFEKGDYEKSASRYMLLMSIYPDEDKYKINYAESLLKLPFSYKTQSLISNFLELYEDKDYAYALKQKVKDFKSNLDYKIGVNYIDKVPMNNQILRWEDDAFPLTVYISTNSENHKQIIKRAFDYWTYATGNFVSFVYTNQSVDANISVIVESEAKSNCPEGGCYYAAALTSPDISNNILEGMNMTLYTTDPYGKAYSYDQFYRTTLHEIGHTLGIMGHSDNPEDLMYSSGQHNVSEYFSEYRNALSRQDLNTLNYLYMIVPNVSNIPESKFNTVNKVHANIILGTSKEIRRRDIENAKAYINNAPNLSVGYINLGNAYSQAELFEKALQTYKKAFDLSLDTDEKYQIVFNMSITALKMGDKDLALQYAEYAQKINPTSEIAKLIHDIKYPFSLGNSRI